MSNNYHEITAGADGCHYWVDMSLLGSEVFNSNNYYLIFKK